MGLFTNPLGYAGYPPNPTTAQVVNSTVRAATNTEAAAGTLKGAYISPATLAAGNTADFASPPPIGTTTPNTGDFTDVTATSSVNTDVLVANNASFTDASVTTLEASILIVTTQSVAGASPIANNARSGQVSFTNVIATTDYGTLTMTNSNVNIASVILATASCATVGSAVGIVQVTPGSGTVAFRLYNSGANSTAANINVNYWVMG